MNICYKFLYAILAVLVFTAFGSLIAQNPAPPVFSHSAGFYFESFELHLTHPDPDVELYYTLDGSSPSENSTLYKGSITISDRSPEPNLFSSIPTNNITGGPLAWREPLENVRKGNVVRVKAFKNSSSSSTVTRSFFVFDEGPNAYSLPVISIITDSLNVFGFEEGIYVPGAYYLEGDDDTGNYMERGRDWERPASFELFENNGSLGHSQDIGIRIHGGFTRRFALKSLRLYARSDYGESRFHFRVFPDQPYESYNRLILRNSGNDFGLSMFMDAAAQSLIRHLNVDTQAYRPAIVFLNGEYWGIHNIRERYERHYLERVYGVDPGNLDILTNDYAANDYEVDEGSADHYVTMMDFIEQADLSEPGNYDHLQTFMDIDNFLDYYSAQIYYGNNDWPQNNNDFWRLNVPYNPDAPTGHDGRWRWLLYDVDRSLGYNTDAEFDMIGWLLRDDWSTALFRNLLNNSQFKTDFINRISDHLNTAFIPERVSTVIDSLRQPLEPVIDEHIARWRNHESRENWENWVQIMHRYAEQRPYNLRQQLKDYFDIGNEVTLTIALQTPAGGYAKVNSTEIVSSTPGVETEPYPWSGIYFSEVPVTLKAVSEEGYRFTHWTTIGVMPEEVSAGEPEITFNPSEDVTFIPHFTESDEVEEVVHYWVFTSDLPNNSPLETISSVYSAAEGGLLEYIPAIFPYPPADGTAGILDRVNDPTQVNYLPSANFDIPFEVSGMRGIRARNPSLVDNRESSLIFHLPTTGFRDLQFIFAAVRTANGPEELLFDYSTDPAQGNWVTTGLEKTSAVMFEAYKRINLSFKDIDAADNNPDFRIRIRFGGEEEIRESDSGNIRFNNISLSGVDFAVDQMRDYVSPEQSVLYQNYPNPFNNRTIIEFELSEQQHVCVEVFNAVGQLVAVVSDEIRSAGSHRVNFYGSGMASGVYFYRITAGAFVSTKSMTFIK